MSGNLDEFIELDRTFRDLAISDDGAEAKMVRLFAREASTRWPDLLAEGSRAKIEGLFFRKQYGIEVIVPTMRPVLPWLAALDRRILNRVVELAPEVLFEGGDPAKLPFDTRRHILRQTCEQVAQPAHGRSMMDYQAVQRFANPDLAEEIGALLDQYAANDDLTWFLLRMVYQGGIDALAAKAKHFALTSRSKYIRPAENVGDVAQPSRTISSMR